MENVLKAIKETFAEMYEVSAEQISDDLDIVSKFDMDSLSMLSAIALLNKKFAIEIPNEDLHKIRTPKDLALLIIECLTNENENLAS